VRKAWPRARLGDLLKQVWREEIVNASNIYRILGARWYAQGLFIKDTKSGHEIRAERVYRVHQGDFVYNRLFAWKGSFALANTDDHLCCVSNEFPCFEIDATRIDPRFLWCYFSRGNVWKKALGLSVGGTPTSRNRLNESRFLGLEIPLPPLPEQRRVVARIEELAERIGEAQGLRQQSFDEVQALFEQCRATVFQAASGTSVVALEQLATLERGKFSHRPRNEPRFFGGNHPWIQIAEIERSNKFIREWNTTLNDDGLAISKKFPKGTVLVSIAATIGATGILAFDCCVPDSIVGVTPRTGIDSEFLYHYLGYVRTHLESVAPQSAQKNINLQILAPLPAPQLPLVEQRKIVAYLDQLEVAVDALANVQGETAAELDALLPAILDRAFKGELV